VSPFNKARPQLLDLGHDLITLGGLGADFSIGRVQFAISSKTLPLELFDPGLDFSELVLESWAQWQLRFTPSRC
jgi:hypothetical protein